MPLDAITPEAAFGMRLRGAREQEGVSLREMARRLSRSHSNLWDYERGHRLATFEIAAEYEGELGLAEGALQEPLEQARREVYGVDRDRRRPFRPPAPVVRPAGPSPADGWSAPPPAGPFVGRDGEMEAARAWLDEARAGEPRIILVRGDAGMGKSTVLAHVLARARAAGWLALRGSCLQGARVAYLPLAAALAPLRPEGRRPMAPPALSELFLAQAEEAPAEDIDPAERTAPDEAADRRHLRLMVAMTSALLDAADRQPIVLAIEDMHWADQSTLGFLELLAALVGQKSVLTPVPLALVVTSRHPQEGDAGWRLVQRLARETSYRELTLRPLDSLQVNQVVTELGSARPAPGLLRAVSEASQGNPLLLRSLLERLLAEGVVGVEGGLLAGRDAQLPAVVLDLDAELSARLRRVFLECVDLLDWAALLGDGQSLTALQSVTGYDDAQFDRKMRLAADARVLYEEEEIYRFDHPELREVLYRRVPIRQRRRKHLAIADYLESHPPRGTGDVAAALAHHLYRAGPEAPLSRLAHAARIAAEQSFALAAWSDAAFFYDICLDAGSSTAADPYLLWCAGVAHYRNHDHGQAEERLVAALEAARSSADERLWGRAVLALTKSRVTGGSWLGADIDLEPVKDFIRNSHDQTIDLRARAYSLLADAHFAMFDFPSGFEQAGLALEAATDVTDDEVIAEVELAVGVQYLAALDLERSEAHLRNCERSAARLSDTWGTGWAASRLPLIHWCRGDLAQADREGARAAAVASEHFDWAESSLAIACRVAVAVAQGRNDQAERLGTLARQQYLRSDYQWTVLVLAPALVVGRALRGESARVSEAIQMVAQTGVDSRWFDLAARAILGEADAVQAGFPDAPFASRPGHAPSLFDLGLAALHAEVCDLTGDAELAQAAIGPLLAAHGAGFAQVVGWVASVPRLLGVVSRCLGRYDEAERWLRSAVAEAEDARAPSELARVRLNLAEVLLARGKERAAAPIIEQAARAVQELGLVALQVRCDRLGQQTSGAPAAWPPRAVS
jgi:transcriptional regulator with XRE-family HTH domain/tetratricopeptide (TPR) repeat protein